MAQSSVIRWVGSCAVLLLLVLTPGCEKPTIPLETRVEEYWALRKGRDFEAAYELEDTRQGPDKEGYLRRMGRSNVVYIRVRPLDSEVDDGVAKVLLQVVYRVPFVPKAMKQRMADAWVNVGGQWYHRMPFQTDEQTPAAGAAGAPRR